MSRCLALSCEFKLAPKHLAGSAPCYVLHFLAYCKENIVVVFRTPPFFVQSCHIGNSIITWNLLLCSLFLFRALVAVHNAYPSTDTWSNLDSSCHFDNSCTFFGEVVNSSVLQFLGRNRITFHLSWESCRRLMKAVFRSFLLAVGTIPRIFSAVVLSWIFSMLPFLRKTSSTFDLKVFRSRPLYDYRSMCWCFPDVSCTVN